MYKTIITAALAAAAAVTPALAQQPSTSKEIDVERIVVPAEQAARRPSAVPPLLPYVSTRTALGYGTYTGIIGLTPSLGYSQPVQWGDTLLPSPWRGYAMAGYLPAFNLTAGAGYRVVRTRAAILDVMAQYDGRSWKQPHEASLYGAHTKYRDQELTAAASLLASLTPSLRLHAALDYAYTQARTHAVDTAVSTNRFGVSAGLSGETKKVRYGFEAAFGYMGWNRLSPVNVYNAGKPTETQIKASANASMPMGSGRLGVAVDGRWVHDNAPDEPLTLGLVRLTPSWQMRAGGATLTLGARLDISSHSDKTLHIAPDVALAYDIAPAFNVHVRAVGGEMLTSAGDLYRWSHLFTPGVASAFSHMPVEAEGGITVGRLNGFWLSATGAYAKVNDMVLPQVVEGRYLWATQADIKGWMLGVEAGYNYRDIVEVKGHYRSAPSGEENLWYRWRDRAKWTAGGSLTVRPIASLSVGLTYQYRSGRKGLQGDVLTGIGTVNSLGLTATWRATPALTVFADVDDVTCHRYQLAPGIYAPAMTGAIGVSMKF